MWISKYNGEYMKYAKVALALLLLISISGCFLTRVTSREFNKMWHGPAYKITNFYRDPDLYAMGIGRVAVIPFVNESKYRDATEKVTGVFSAELKKTGAFGVVLADDVECNGLIESVRNRGMIDYEQAARLAQKLNVDALVVGRITNYFPYHRSPVLGLDVAMIYPAEQKVVWQVDELYDSTDFRVMNSIRKYFDKEFSDNASDFNFEVFLYSIMRYSQFVSHEVAGTLLVEIKEPVSEEKELEKVSLR